MKTIQLFITISLLSFLTSNAQITRGNWMMGGNYNLTYEWIIPNSYVRNHTDTAYRDVNPRSSYQLNIGIRAWNECDCTDWFYKLFDVISTGTGGGGTGGGGNALTPAN